MTSQYKNDHEQGCFSLKKTNMHKNICVCRAVIVIEKKSIIEIFFERKKRVCKKEIRKFVI